MKLDARTRELIAIGTAIGANCHSCLKYHVAKARERSISEVEIAEAVETGKGVRSGAQGRMDKLAAELLDPTHPELAPLGCCGD